MNKESQSDVTNRLRCAIKKKLSEISDFDFGDDELPEYIMILVANQRSKSQIEKDLALFLKDDTVNFTNWLWDLLNSINIGPKSNLSAASKSDLNVPKPTDIDADEDAILLDYDNDSLCQDDTNDSNLSRLSVQSPLSVLEESFKENEGLIKELSNKTLDVLDDAKKSPVQQRPTTVLEEAFKDSFKTRPSLKVKEKNKIPQFVQKKYQKVFSVKNASELVSSKVVPVRKHLIDFRNEYDPLKPEYVSKPYRPTPRNHGRPAALQANKLLLKAVDDATKSILVGKSIEDFYKPTPIKVLTSDRVYDSYIPKGNNSSVRANKRTEIIPRSEFNSDVSQVSGSNEQEYTGMFIDESFATPRVSINKSRTICLRTIPLVSDGSKTESMECTPRSTSEYSFPTVEEMRPKSPHFIVTLEGVNLSSFKRKLDDNSVDSMEEDEDTTIAEEEASPNKKLKMTERCKYWPACKNSDQCVYHHPTVPCKCFPDCKFGDKCLYIHPNCKFDALCSRKECPFTHVSKRKLPLTSAPAKMVPVKNRKARAVCKYYPKCTARKCAFIHPKLCRYGTDCRLSVCLFSHFPLPSRSQLKWQAA